MIKRSRLEEALCRLLGGVIGSTISMSVANKERQSMMEREARRYNDARCNNGALEKKEIDVEGEI